ncbi:MAG: hypothetical protein ACPGSD_00260 [Flavobacteriales bacterium]
MIRVFLITFFLLISHLCFAQQEDEQMEKNGLTRAITQIQRLKNGALLVKLYQKERQIELLKRINKEKALESYIADVKKNNLEIIKAFSENFEFCPVYFFYSKDAQNVKERAFENMNFVNRFGEEDSTIVMQAEYFYAGSITESRIDTFKYHSQARDNHSRSINAYSSPKSSSSFEAFVFQSDKLIDLFMPFPYLTRTFGSLPVLKRSNRQLVNRLNVKLNKFYDRYKNVKLDVETGQNQEN